MLERGDMYGEPCLSELAVSELGGIVGLSFFLITPLPAVSGFSAWWWNRN